MPLIDDLKMPVEDEEYSRRAFLNAAGFGAMAVAILGTGVTAIRYLWPEVLFEEETRYRIGKPEEIPVGMLVALPEQKLFVFHDAQGFFAMSAVCTHLGCLTRYEKEENRIFCPCHGSRYSTDGQVVVGPAPRALHRLAMTLEQGALVVDAAKTVEPDAVLKV
jgi:menaquinol-cytochrome c reductase iron-sulfur subunit